MYLGVGRPRKEKTSETTVFLTGEMLSKPLQAIDCLIGT